MCALLRNSPQFQDDNIIGVLDGTETVGNYDGRPALGCPLEGGLDNALPVDVDSGGCLI